MRVTKYIKAEVYNYLYNRYINYDKINEKTVMSINAATNFVCKLISKNIIDVERRNNSITNIKGLDRYIYIQNLDNNREIILHYNY